MFLLDRPDAPTDIIVSSCEGEMTKVSWQAGSSNNDLVIEHTVRVVTNFDDPHARPVECKYNINEQFNY